MPAWAEATKPGKAQHSSTELLFFAEIAVRFNAGATKDEEEGQAVLAEDVVDVAPAAVIDASNVYKVDRSFMIAVLSGTLISSEWRNKVGR